MIQRIKQLMLVGLTSFALLVPSLAIPAAGGMLASAGIKGKLCQGASAASGEDCDSTSTNLTDSTGGLENLATKIVNIFSVIIGAIAIIMLLFGGLRYITSGGDSSRVGNAKNTLLYAIIGLVVVALAQIIVNVVLGAASDAGGSLTGN